VDPRHVLRRDASVRLATAPIVEVQVPLALCVELEDASVAHAGLHLQLTAARGASSSATLGLVLANTSQPGTSWRLGAPTGRPPA
jgi:hypothetical protein